MLKLLLTGLWVCAVALGAVYFSVQSAVGPSPAEEAAKKEAGLELVKGESINIPVINGGAVNGYFLAKVSLRVHKDKAAKIDVPLRPLMTDALFTLLSGSTMANIADVSTFDAAAFKTRIRDDLNARFGDAVVADVLVEQLDYLSKADIRAQNGNAPSSVKIVEGEKVEAPAGKGAKSGGGH